MPSPTTEDAARLHFECIAYRREINARVKHFLQETLRILKSLIFGKNLVKSFCHHNKETNPHSPWSSPSQKFLCNYMVGSQLSSPNHFSLQLFVLWELSLMDSCSKLKSQAATHTSIFKNINKNLNRSQMFHFLQPLSVIELVLM